MKLKQIGSNMTELNINGVSVLFSYDTPVAGWDSDGSFRTDEHYSPTTTKHINKYLGGVIAALSPTNEYGQNIRNADTMCRIFVDGGYVEDTKPSTYNTMRDKAWSILQSMPHNIDDVAFILNGPKITDFAYCIMGEDVCVIDGHAWCIANNDRRTMQKVPNIGKKLRAELQECYRRAGKKHGMTAYQMQAATWVAWKRIHNV